MNTIKVKSLTYESFRKYGSFSKIENPDTPYIGKSPVRFYRDILPLQLREVSVSTTVIEPIPFIVDKMEYHSDTGEAFMMLNGDAVICLGVATADGNLPEQLEAFYVPKGVMIYVHPGVWHYAPFPTKNEVLYSLVLLPPRTYALDCSVLELPEEQQYELLIK